MSSLPPPDDPEFTSEPKVLSPVSPKPVHIPVPTNIPLLQTQNDPHFGAMDDHNGAVEGSRTEEQASQTGSSEASHLQEPSQELINGTSDPAGELEGSATDQSNGMNVVLVDDPPAEASVQSVAEPAAAEQQASHDLSSQTATIASAPDAAPIDASQTDSLEGPSSAQGPAPSTSENASGSQPIALPSGPDYQALLSSLANPAVATPTDPAPSYIPLDGTSDEPNTVPAGSTQLPGSSGLPPRPDAQAQADARQYHPHGVNATPVSSARNGANGLPPPPVASFQNGPSSGAPLHGTSSGAPGTKSKPDDTAEDERWNQETQKEFDNFLDQERHFVTEGNWEQFPYGSRLFVGNLSSERVTKRDVFHVFHKYGSLAQISIKQAYGFVQFIKEADCSRAMSAEQGRIIRGKRINLEISKPQKNNRGAGGGNRRRSRSPERASGGVDRYISGGNRRGRDDYRPGRSPSPRGHRDRSRDRHGRYRSRSRSPRRRSDRYRSPSPKRDDDDDLPLPRRAPRDVPEVQIVADDNLSREFIQWVERGVSSRGVKVDVLILSPRLSEAAVIKRQILEGVTAVCKLTLANQQKCKVPLQVFDRRNGNDIRFEEYADLDPNIAGEVVLRAKANNQPTYGYGYGGGGSGQAPPSTYAQQPSSAAAPSGLDANSLQKLLGAIQNPGQPAPPGMPDLARLLGSAAQQGSFGQGAPGQDPLAALRNNPALAGLLGGQSRAPPQAAQAAHAAPQQPAAAGQPDMADILAKLGKYRR